MALALAHYILNLTWAPVFFGLHWIAAAAVINVGLVASLVEVMGKFWPVSQKAALLLVPYAAWVVFATFLNIEILRLNRGKPESKGISAL
jgi:tryptophan-rich sensory protein